MLTGSSGDDMDNLSGFDFLRGLVRQHIQEARECHDDERMRPTTAVFKGVPRDRALGSYINRNPIAPHCGRYRPSFALVKE